MLSGLVGSEMCIRDMNQTEPLLGYYSEKKLLDSIKGDQNLEDVNTGILNVLAEKVI